MLQLYAYYKIATEGPCSTTQPSAFQPTARAKWYATLSVQRLKGVLPICRFCIMMNELN